jgi:hypothetical protein
MNNFIYIASIGEYDIKFNPNTRDNDQDGYRATFYIYTKGDLIKHKVNFEITRSKYNSIEGGNAKTNRDIINEKYGNIEEFFKCFGLKYIQEKFEENDLKSETVNSLNIN